jgi:hypothetical protein
LWGCGGTGGHLIEVSGAREGHTGDGGDRRSGVAIDGDENVAACGGRVFARIDGNL